MEVVIELEVKRVGNSTELILLKDFVNRPNLQQGQWLHVSELPDGGVRLSQYDPDFDATMSMIDEIMDEYRDTLRALAK